MELPEPENVDTSLFITVENRNTGLPIVLRVIRVGVGGDEKELITAVAMVMVENEKIRRIINEAGKLANKIRSGEIAKPDINVRNN